MEHNKFFKWCMMYVNKILQIVMNMRVAKTCKSDTQYFQFVNNLLTLPDNTYTHII